MGDTVEATTTAVAPVALAKEKAEREMDAAVEETVEAEDTEERLEALFGEAPAKEIEDPEVPRGRGCAMMRICLP